MPLATGDRLGPYEILAPLGAGGMGAVFRARDPRLGREVAIKVLHPDKFTDAESRQRFLYEAKTVSSLNHPNIVTIYDIGSEGETVFLVMELIEGQTLERLIPASGMNAADVLRIASEVASAFAKAHAAGIVHRDLKPANVMITNEGRVKVLDFGLAKLVPSFPPPNGATQTMSNLTHAGAVMGTPAYMSPEQADGKPLDARSDIFSFGTLLYEMASGQRPFGGDSYMSVIASVMRDEPKPLPPSAPAGVSTLILRCLSKAPEKRPQAMTEVQSAIESEKTASAANLIPQAESQGRKPWLLASGFAVAFLAVAGYFTWGTLGGKPAQESLIQPIPFTTYAGFESQPDFSPDGNQVVFRWTGDRDDNYDIYVKMLGAESPLRLTSDPAMDMIPRWSPDGRNIAFIRAQVPRSALTNQPFSVMLVPPLGGSERKVAQFYSRINLYGVLASLAWAPDSKHLFVSGSTEEGVPNQLLLLSIETGEVKPVAKLKGLATGYSLPAVSFDGRTLSAIAWDTGARPHLWSLSPALELGPERVLDTGTAGVNYTTFTADSREILFNLNLSAALPMNRISIEGGDVRPVIFTGAMARDAAVSRHGNHLVFSNTILDSDLWEVTLGGSGEPERRPLARSSFRDVAPQYSPNGKRIAFYSNRGGSIQIWVADADGSHATQLTSMNPQATTGTPRWSPDGSRLAFDSDATGEYQTYVIGADGGQPKQITQAPSAGFIATWSPDGRWIYHTSNRSGTLQIWRIPAEGGNPEQVTQNGGAGSYFSPDGKWLYYTKEDGRAGLWRMPANGGPEAKILDSVFRYNYQPTADGIYWVPALNPNRTGSVRYYDLRSKTTTEILKIHKGVDLGLAVSPDGKKLTYVEREYAGQDLMLVENFR